MRTKAMLIVVLTMSLAAMGQSAAKKSESGHGSGKEKLLFQLEKDFCDAATRDGAEGWMRYMADDSIEQRDKAYVGKDAIRGLVSADWSDPTFKLKWRPVTGRMFASEKMGYTTGHFVASGTGKDGKAWTSEGDYLSVWKKQPDGSWKVLWDGGSSN